MDFLLNVDVNYKFFSINKGKKPIFNFITYVKGIMWQ